MTSFARRLDGAHPPIGGFVCLDGALAPEIAGCSGLDFVILDMQHGAVGPDGLPAQIQAAGLGGASVLVRVPWNDPALTMRALDCGADGVVAPMIDRQDDVERFVAACLYPPRGQRSWGPFRALPASGLTRTAFEAEANDRVAAIAMVETAGALDEVAAIAAVPGLTALYVGPNDLSAALGLGYEPVPKHPRLLAALERVLAAAAGAGVKAGIHCADAAMARAMLATGFGFATIGTDAGLLAGALADTLAAARAS